MKLGELKKMTPPELGRKYWKCVSIAKTHPQKNLRAAAKNTAQVVLDEFQRRLVTTGCGFSIEDFQ